MISVLYLDCDGVLTTGTYLYDDSGKQYKKFSSIDSNAIKEANEAGLTVEVISSDPTGDDINEARCQDMGVPYHRAIDRSKEDVARDRLDALGVGWDEVAAMGDDVTDRELLRLAAFPLTVPHAAADIDEVVSENDGYTTEKFGGRGAVAEAIRHLLETTKTV